MESWAGPGNEAIYDMTYFFRLKTSRAPIYRPEIRILLHLGIYCASKKIFNFLYCYNSLLIAKCISSRLQIVDLFFACQSCFDSVNCVPRSVACIYVHVHVALGLVDRIKEGDIAW